MLISNYLIGKLLERIRLLEHFDEDDVDMIRYSLQAILWEIEKISILFLVFTILRYQDYLLVTFFVLISIRAIAGGYHSKSSLYCLIITFLGFFLAIVILPLITLNNISIFVLSVFSLTVTLLAAPTHSIETEFLKNKDKDKHKKIVVFFITFIWLVIIVMYRNNIYAYPALWTIVLQNSQLLFEHIRRKRDIKC